MTRHLKDFQMMPSGTCLGGMGAGQAVILIRRHGWTEWLPEQAACSSAGKYLHHTCARVKPPA